MLIYMQIRTKTNKIFKEKNMKKTELTRADYGFIGKRILDEAKRIAGGKEKTTYEDFVKKIQNTVHGDKASLLYEIGEWYYFNDTPDGIGTPNPLKMLGRYIELAEHNGIDGGTNIEDIKAKSKDISELVKGYIYEASMLYLEEMKEIGVCDIDRDMEVLEKELAEIIHGFFSVTSDELLEGNVEEYEIEELSEEIWRDEEYKI
mgnify:CR=1 FL=1